MFVFGVNDNVSQVQSFWAQNIFIHGPDNLNIIGGKQRKKEYSQTSCGYSQPPLNIPPSQHCSKLIISLHCF